MPRTTHKSSCAACRKRFWDAMGREIWLRSAWGWIQAMDCAGPAYGLDTEVRVGRCWVSFKVILPYGGRQHVFLHRAQSPKYTTGVYGPNIRSLQGPDDLAAALTWMEEHITYTNKHTCGASTYTPQRR